MCWFVTVFPSVPAAHSTTTCWTSRRSRSKTNMGWSSKSELRLHCAVVFIVFAVFFFQLLTTCISRPCSAPWPSACLIQTAKTPSPSRKATQKTCYHHPKLPPQPHQRSWLGQRSVCLNHLSCMFGQRTKAWLLLPCLILGVCICVCVCCVYLDCLICE